MMTFEGRTAMVREQVRWFFQAVGSAIFPGVRACLGALYLAEEGRAPAVPAPRRPDESEAPRGASGAARGSRSTASDPAGSGPGLSAD